MTPTMIGLTMFGAMLWFAAFVIVGSGRSPGGGANAAVLGEPRQRAVQRTHID